MRRPKVTATACSNLLSEAMLSSRLMSTYFLAMQCQCNAVLLPAGTAREGNNWIYIMGYRELIISIALYHLHQPRCLAWANVDMVFKNQGEAPLVYLLIFLGHFTKTFGCIFMIVHTLFIFVHLPWGYHEEVHEVPGVPHVASLVQHEAQGQNLCTHLSCEHHHEDNLELLL